MRSVRLRTFGLSLSAMLATLAAPASAAGIEGVWRTEDGKGEVRIARCGTQWCGSIARVTDNRPNLPTTDVNNPDRSLRTRRLVGLRTLWGFTREGATWTGGRAYDPKSGKTYRAELKLNPDGSLRVTGCVLVVCRSQRWTKV